jgi:5-methylcytosine-specific restriction enzyme subunit McrC
LLKPDLLIDMHEQRWILDAKWKRLDAGKPEKNYDLSQSDFYQLFAYGHKYRRDGTVPKMVLIYPYWSGLQQALPVFDYDGHMSLWVLPFDLDSDRLIGAEKAALPLSCASFACAS